MRYVRAMMRGDALAMQRAKGVPLSALTKFAFPKSNNMRRRCSTVTSGLLVLLQRGTELTIMVKSMRSNPIPYLIYLK
eukprot:6183652-Pleurochrysis_carterae.AAC.3